jgi:exopolysaccharide production protein ExoQ
MATTIPDSAGMASPQRRSWHRPVEMLRYDKRVQLFFQIVLLALFYMICVNLRYAPANDAYAAAENLDGEVLAAQAGSAFRQFFYFALFGIVTLVAFYVRGLKNLHSISYAYLIACIWCLLSATWAIDPGISIRRSLGMVVVLASMAFTIDLLGARQTVRLMYIFLGFSVVVSIITACLSSIPLFSFAVHPANELDPELIGTWKGVFRHKNVTGAVMAYATILFFHHSWRRRGWMDIALFFGAAFVLFKTDSKTSLGWVGISLMFSYILYRCRVGNPSKRILFWYGLILLIATAGMLVAINWDLVYAYFSDYDTLSGRVAIWASIMPYIREHFLLGSGYGSFYAIGEASPMLRLGVNKVVAAVGHSHSGYFEILLTTGIIGLILALVALVFLPFYRFWTSSDRDIPLASMGAGVWFFGVVQNFTEAQFFAPDKESWSFVVVFILVMHTRFVAAKRGETQWLADTNWDTTRTVRRGGWSRRYRPQQQV